MISSGEAGLGFPLCGPPGPSGSAQEDRTFLQAGGAGALLLLASTLPPYCLQRARGIPGGQGGGGSGQVLRAQARERAPDACVDLHQRGTVRTVTYRGAGRLIWGQGPQCPRPATPTPTMALWLPIPETPVGEHSPFLPRRADVPGSADQPPWGPGSSLCLELSVGSGQVTSHFSSADI